MTALDELGRIGRTGTPTGPVEVWFQRHTVGMPACVLEDTPRPSRGSPDCGRQDQPVDCMELTLSGRSFGRRAWLLRARAEAYMTSSLTAA
jgi:hypothetical protein